MDEVRLLKAGLSRVCLDRAGVGVGAGSGEVPPSFVPYGIGIMLKGGAIVDMNDPRLKASYGRDEIEGIAFQRGGMSVVICPDVPPSAYFCGGRSVCPDASVVTTAAIAGQQFNGAENTAVLRRWLTADGTWAVNRAYNTIVNGRNCYLPSLGELMAIWRCKAEVDALLVRCGCEALPAASYWSSALATRQTADGENSDDPNAFLAWVYGIYGNGDWDGFNVQGFYRVLAIAAL